jgi:hypothetical protein
MVVGLFDEYELAMMVSHVGSPGKDDVELIAVWFFLKVFRRNCCMALKPFIAL